ncbi:TetR family transcriptional regulator C-terminal domain-containing protein [Colwellia echini]|uniref:TetR family transcriptional regulator n=1 Tax=Colwellia echini TaxID=1982103 RepID=A0ABY3N0U6_9GAMM|nr:TetR family transcriptional regulator C-terminal domain-containing protein [Colwellia echini]TYK66986.1 TetR family transcriptional regulator [Colwellia echini]
MQNENKKPRGRPAKSGRDSAVTKDELIRSGVEHFTQFGFAASGLDQILKKVSIPKGSFYYYFASKEAFGLAVIDYYDNYFCRKLDAHLSNENLPLKQRLTSFVDDAKAGIEKYDFKRGCLVGNLEQEIALLPDSHREKLFQVMQGWQNKVSKYLTDLNAGFTDNPNHSLELSNIETDSLAEFFWLGWEGAVSRCKLVKSTQPIDLFMHHFSTLMKLD